MRKLSFLFLLIPVFLLNTSSLQAQSFEFLSQLKTIITSGENGEMGKLKGELLEHTREREEQYRIYKCLQPLKGFYIDFKERKESFFLFITAQSKDSSKIYIEDLLNKEVRERSGIFGYTATNENDVGGTNTLLQKSGSKVTLKIMESADKVVLVIALEVRKNNAPVIPPPTPIKTTQDFLLQLKTIINAASYGLASHKSKLMHTKESGVKNYGCDLMLEGFKTYIQETVDGDLRFFAEEDDWNLSSINAKKFIDKLQREKAGLIGYTTTYEALRPTSNAEGVTRFDKEGELLLISVYKNLFGRGYRIEIEEIRME